MESETPTPSPVSILVRNVTNATRRFVRFLSKVFKPGGWRYLRPTPTQETPAEQQDEQQPPAQKRKAA